MKKYNLERFISAQNYDYSIALKEIKNGRKLSHWIWYIFPQMKGLGRSYNSEFYGIEDINEAKEYLNNEILGPRLIEISQALLTLNENNPVNVMGSIDSIKLQSCMTLFAKISENNSVFHKVLDKFFDGKPDAHTLEILSH